MIGSSRLKRIPLSLPPKTSFFFDPNINKTLDMAKYSNVKPNLVKSHLMTVDTDSDGVCDNFASASGVGITATFSMDTVQKIQITASASVNVSYVYQIVQVIAGQIISFQFDYKVDGDVRAFLNVDWYENLNYLSSSVVAYGTSTSYAALQLLNLTAPATCTQATIKIGLHPLVIGNVGSVWIKAGMAILRSTINTNPDSHPGIIYPGASPVLVPGGFKFAGGSSQYLYANDNSNFDQTDISKSNPLTIFTVIKLDSITASQYIINKNTSSANDRQYGLVLDDAVGGKIKGVLENANAGTGNLYTRILNITDWFAVIFSADSVFATYITNGHLDSRTGNTVTRLTPRPYFRIGCRSNGLDGAAGTSFLYGTLGLIGICRCDPWVVMRWMKKYCYGRWPIRWER